MEIELIENKEVRQFKAFIESETTPGTYYKIELNKTLECSCPQGKYKGECKHIKEINKKYFNKDEQ